MTIQSDIKQNKYLYIFSKLKYKTKERQRKIVEYYDIEIEETEKVLFVLCVKTLGTILILGQSSVQFLKKFKVVGYANECVRTQLLLQVVNDSKD